MTCFLYHSWSLWRLPAFWTENIGIQYRICQSCGVVQSRTVIGEFLPDGIEEDSPTA